MISGLGTTALLICAIFTAQCIGINHAEDLLTQSMSFMDRIYDPEAGYLFYLNSALLHETRSSAWYAAGLLARNENDDRDQAIKIIGNIISPQFRNASEQWYGDYQSYPEQPDPGTEAYPADIYNTWDPNWRGFIGTTFIVILEEFQLLLPQALQDTMIQSLHLNAVGDTYRVGGVDDDNLYPEYSNAAIMHAAVSGWIGRKTNDANLTADAEKWGRDIVALFDRNSTLSEFNGPTYAGVSLFGLTLWAKYLPQDSVLGANGGRMITAVWDSIGSLYNANLKNMAGPWDRSYGFDMNRYLSITALWIWTFVGLPASPLYNNPSASAHVDDFEIGPLVAILAPYHSTFLSETALSSLTTFPGTHFVHTSAYSPFADLVPRNYTTYLSPSLMIGAQSFHENVIGGPSVNPSQFNPVVAQWEREGNSIGFFSLYAQEYALQAEVGEGTLELTYPEGNSSSTFTFLVSPNGIPGPRNVRSWEDVKGISVNVTAGTVDLVPTIGFCGLSGGLCDAVHGFDLWNITYHMPMNSTAIPNIVLSIELE